VSVVIPTLNEARNIPHVFELIPSWIHELIVVDGLSHDDTIAVAKEHFPGVLVVLEGTRGKGAALRAGFEAATGDIIVMLDADGSTDPGEIAAFVGLLMAGADVAMGSRFAMGGGTADMEAHRRAGNWALTRLVRVGFGARFSDLCYGYTAFWRDVLPALDGPFRGFEVETVLHIRAVRAGLKIAEVPSFEKKRVHGVTNLRTIRDGFRVLRAIGSEWADEHLTGTRTVPHGALRPSATRPTKRVPWHAAPPAPPGALAETGNRMRSV
jgi:glycosyltransferase involved in cell wall biosynthesis